MKIPKDSCGRGSEGNHFTPHGMGRTRGDRRGSWDPSDDRVFSSVAETLARDAGPVEELARRAAESFAAPLAASTAAFLVTARLARRSAYALGVSCATPMVGAVMSVCAVGGSAALAGQAAREATSWASAGRGDARVGGRASWLFPSGFGRARADAPWDEREMTADAILGSLMYAALGRGLKTAMPSDVSHPGAMARKSLPANGAHYASEGQKRTLARWMARHGCHHCGTKVGAVIGDHMPPNKVAFGSSAAAEAFREGTQSLWTRAWQAVGGVPKQRFFPQCRGCSDLQSVAVRTGVKKLVMHGGGVKIGAVVAGCVAARHYAMARHPEEYAKWEAKLEELKFRFAP